MKHNLNVVHYVKAYGEDVTSLKVVENISKSLPRKFVMVVIAIEERKNLAQFSIEELTSSLLDHEPRISRHGNSLENAFQF